MLNLRVSLGIQPRAPTQLGRLVISVMFVIAVMGTVLTSPFTMTQLKAASVSLAVL